MISIVLIYRTGLPHGTTTNYSYNSHLSIRDDVDGLVTRRAGWPEETGSTIRVARCIMNSLHYYLSYLIPYTSCNFYPQVKLVELFGLTYGNPSDLDKKGEGRGKPFRIFVPPLNLAPFFPFPLFLISFLLDQTGLETLDFVLSGSHR
jgi:hypothetical protein